METHTKKFNRWLVVAGAILIQLALGAIYAWSVFTQRLIDAAGDYRFTASETAWIFSAGLATFAIVMVLAGRWQARVGPTLVSIVGGITLGAGYILGGLFGSTFWTQILFIGVIGGAGIGLAYVVPIAVGVKWFPDRKGMITGLAVAGFGFGATIWVKLAGSWFGGLLNTTHLFGLPGVQSVFFIYGIAFAVLVLLGSTVMINPPEGYTPEGWVPPHPQHSNGTGAAWGAISDKIGRKAAIVLMSASQGIIMLMTYHVFIVFGLVPGFILAACLIGFNFGGNFALFPAATADFFGNKKVGGNYGWVFTAYGVAGIAGPPLAGYFKDAAMGASQPIVWMAPFVIAGAACLLGAIVMALFTPPGVGRGRHEQAQPALPLGPRVAAR